MASNDKQFKVVYAISRKAYGMVKDGDANISSGGVRTKDGKLVELAVPTSYSIKNNVPQWNMPNSIFAPIAMASSLFTDYSSPQAARVLMVAFWLSPYTAGALEESSLPEHRHFAPKTIRRDGCIGGRIPCFFQHAEGIVSPPSQSIVRRL